ncbi:MAG: O-antigen ligase family protein [Oculatellaceae cyanobacterium Prado106]|nr:O-antigen ligase family protein [Oculatellaceae cyanobacterium Prado106]
MFPWINPLFRISFVTLPYLFYGSFVGLFVVMMALRAKFRATALDPLTRNGLVVISVLLLLSCGFARDRTESLLQLSNFLPFFMFFSVLPYVMRSVDRLHQLATDMVIAAIPINLIALGEYLLKSPWMPRVVRRFPPVRALRSAPHKGRAMVMFTHPNSLANYLVLILGLGLGLILYENWRTPGEGEGKWRSLRTKLLYLGTALTLVGIFCSGSRNGLMIAAIQILIFCCCIKTNRRIRVAALLTLIGMGISVMSLGAGRRAIALWDWANDPRPRVWGIAWDMIQERPCLGWGLGHYKFEYLPRLLQQYPTCLLERTLTVIPSNCADVTHPHNVWLLLAVEAGIPVMVLFTVFIGYLCFRCTRPLFVAHSPGFPWSLERSPAAAVRLAYLLALCGGFVFACFDVTLYDVRLNATHWALLAGLYGITFCNPKTLQKEAKVLP